MDQNKQPTDQPLPLHTIRKSYADTLSAEERQALIETLQTDISLRVGNKFSSDFTAECMLRALQDAQGLS